ncbi:hypothetical protein SNEBB_004665 [Seison nebaliae]|nr:hypothetical protein SNEBB_004665 [Seison nebaliae]
MSRLLRTKKEKIAKVFNNKQVTDSFVDIFTEMAIDEKLSKKNLKNRKKLYSLRDLRTKWIAAVESTQILKRKLKQNEDEKKLLEEEIKNLNRKLKGLTEQNDLYSTMIDMDGYNCNIIDLCKMYKEENKKLFIELKKTKEMFHKNDICSAITSTHKSKSTQS